MKYVMVGNLEIFLIIASLLLFDELDKDGENVFKTSRHYEKNSHIHTYELRQKVYVLVYQLFKQVTSSHIIRESEKRKHLAHQKILQTFP